MKLLVVCLLGLLAVVSAQFRGPCKPRFPDFEARSIGHDPMRDSVEIQRIYYDGFRKAIRHVDEIYENKTSEALDILFLYETKKMYVVDMKAKTCHERPLTAPFRAIAPPPNSTFHGEMWIGAEGYGEGVLIESWHTQMHGGEMHSHWTRQGCLPVSHSFYSDTTGIIFRNYYDVSFGIRDRGVFDPPKDCKSTTLRFKGL